MGMLGKHVEVCRCQSAIGTVEVTKRTPISRCQNKQQEMSNTQHVHSIPGHFSQLSLKIILPQVRLAQINEGMLERTFNANVFQTPTKTNKNQSALHVLFRRNKPSNFSFRTVNWHKRVHQNQKNAPILSKELRRRTLERNFFVIEDRKALDLEHLCYSEDSLLGHAKEPGIFDEAWDQHSTWGPASVLRDVHDPWPRLITA